MRKEMNYIKSTQKSFKKYTNNSKTEVKIQIQHGQRNVEFDIENFSFL